MLVFRYEGGHYVIGSAENMESCCKVWSHMSVKVTSGYDALAKKLPPAFRPDGLAPRKSEGAGHRLQQRSQHHTSAVAGCCGGYVLSGCLRDEFRSRCEGGGGRAGAWC
jgi:hypothetical protein